MPAAAGSAVQGQAAVEVDHLTIRYGDLTAVDGVSFSARAGAVTVLLGPNGAGKTSIVEYLEGYRTPTSGRGSILGLDPVGDHGALTRQVGVMLQSGGVYTGIRPPEVLRLFAAYHDDPVEPDELLEMVGLADRRTTTWRSLSGGERQRLSLALALVGRPRVAFLDEPTAGVDLEGRRLIRKVITELRADGVAVVLTTHDLEDAEVLADRIVIIDAGRVVADGTPDDLLSDHDVGSFSFRAAAGLDRADLGATLGGRVIEEQPGSYRVDATPTPTRVSALTAWLADRDLLVGDLRAGRQRLDDVFSRLTGERSVADPDSGSEPGANAGPRRRRRRS